jgi:hypothetical protein
MLDQYINGLNLSLTQDQRKSSNGGLLTAPRESHPSEDRSELSLLVATAHGLRPVSTLDFTAGQEYRPIACHRRIGGNPIVIAGRFSLVARFSREVMARPLTWLMLITMAMGMCLTK